MLINLNSIPSKKWCVANKYSFKQLSEKEIETIAKTLHSKCEMITKIKEKYKWLE